MTDDWNTTGREVSAIEEMILRAAAHEQQAWDYDTKRLERALFKLALDEFGDEIASNAGFDTAWKGDVDTGYPVIALKAGEGITKGMFLSYEAARDWTSQDWEYDEATDQNKTVEHQNHQARGWTLMADHMNYGATIASSREEDLEALRLWLLMAVGRYVGLTKVKTYNPTAHQKGVAGRENEEIPF